MAKFRNIEVAKGSIAEYIPVNIPDNTKTYTLINDVSHGDWRNEQAPINDEDYVDVCETLNSI